MTPSEIRDTRTSLHLTQAEFGRLLDAHMMTVSRWEAGQLTPSGFQEALLKAFRRTAVTPGTLHTALYSEGLAAVLGLLLTHQLPAGMFGSLGLPAITDRSEDVTAFAGPIKGLLGSTL